MIVLLIFDLQQLKMNKPINNSFITVGVYLFLFLSTLLLLYPVIFTKEASFYIIGDNLHLGYAFLNKLSISLHKGHLPIWDANTFGGKNFPGELQSGTFYPLNILWSLLFGSIKGIDVYYLDLLVALHYFICLTGMYSLARLFNMSRTAAVGSALTFAFSGILAARSGCETHIFYGLALLPWAIYFLAKYYWAHPHKKYLVCSGLFCGLQILAGHLQPFFHTLLISAIMISFYECLSRKKWYESLPVVFFNLFIVALAALIIALPEVYYAAEYLSRCYREVGSNGTYIGPNQKVPIYIYMYRFVLNPSDFENLAGQKSVLITDYNFVYMGILPLFLCIIFFLKGKILKLSEMHIYLKKLLVIILVTGVLSVLGYLTFFGYILYSLPFINGVRELSRYVILISFSGALLVGLALTYIRQLGDLIFQNFSKALLCIVLLLTSNTLYWVFFQQEHVSLNVSIPYLFAFVFLLLLMNVQTNVYCRLLAIGFLLIDFLLNPVNFQSTQSVFYPSTFYARNKIITFLETTYGKYRVTFDMDTYAFTRRNLGDIYAIQTKFGYGGTINESYYNFIYSKNPGIDDLLNVKYVISDKQLDSNFRFKDSVGNLRLYERRNWYPRCYWQHQLGEKGDAIEAENQTNISELSYSDDYQKWSVYCSSPDTLIFSENVYPGWVCYDNQKEIAIHPASIRDYPPLFRGIALNKGHHIIEFKYKKTFYWF